MDTCGTIKVYIRPGSKPKCGDNKTETQVSPKCAISNLHTFDKVFVENSTQELIFRCSVKRMILQALDGYSITTIAYGSISSGRTYTLFGEPAINTEDAGLMPRSVGHIFDVLEEEQLEYLIQVSYLEIYNEQMFDLLSPNVDDTELIITEDILQTDSVIIQGLTEVTIRNMDELYEILKQGAENRIKYSVLKSSPSCERHTLFYVSVYTKEDSINGETVLKRGKLIFVDVAASDYSVPFGQTNMVSLENTNHKSLNTLNRCLSKLADKSTDIPYEESKLTQLLQESLGGCTRTILFGTVDFSSSEGSLATDDFLHNAKKVKTKPWMRHVFNKNNVLERYTTEIDNVDTDIVNICTKQNSTPITEDINMVSKEFEENQKMISDKIKRAKFLRSIKKRWLKVYKNFENIEPEPEPEPESMSVPMPMSMPMHVPVPETEPEKVSENNYFESDDFQKFLSRYAEKHIEIGEEHVENINSQAEIINKQLKKLCSRSRLFRKNVDRSMSVMSKHMHKLKEKAYILQQFLNSKDMCLPDTNQRYADNWKDFKLYFDSSTELVGASLVNNKKIIGILSKLSASLEHLRILDKLKIFEQKSCEFLSPCIKDLTDHKEYVAAVKTNISASITEITNSGQQYIDTSHKLFTETKKNLTESMELQKTHRMDFEERYKSAIDTLKQMKSSSDEYFKKTNEQSLACKNNLEARQVSLTESKDMISKWQRQCVMKVTTFAQNVAKNRETQKQKLTETKTLLTQTNNYLLKNISIFQKGTSGLDMSMMSILYRQEKNIKRQEEKLKLFSTTYFNDHLAILQGLVYRTASRIELEENEENELIECSDEFINKTKPVCSEDKTICTYLINKFDYALEAMKLAKIEEVVSSLVLRKRNKLPPVAESKEESEDDSSGHSTITLMPEPIVEKVKCELPEYEGTLRERCKKVNKRKRTSRRRRKFEEAKARKESS